MHLKDPYLNKPRKLHRLFTQALRITTIDDFNMGMLPSLNTFYYCNEEDGVDPLSEGV